MSAPQGSSVPSVSGSKGVGASNRPAIARTLSFFGFFAITASMVMTVYEYPSFASSGFQLVFIPGPSPFPRRIKRPVKTRRDRR